MTFGVFLNRECMATYDTPEEALRAALEATEETGVAHEMKKVKEGGH